LHAVRASVCPLVRQSVRPILILELKPVDTPNLVVIFSLAHVTDIAIFGSKAQRSRSHKSLENENNKKLRWLLPIYLHFHR